MIMVVEGLKQTISDSSSVGTQGFHGDEPRPLQYNDAKAANITEPLMEQTSTAQSTTICTTPANQRKRPWPLLSSPESPPNVTRPQEQRFEPSPAMEWPHRSPMKPEHEQDVASFVLLDQSFETLSEAEHLLRPTPEKTTDQPPRKICVGRDEIGDISPIKLEGAAGTGQKKERGHDLTDAGPGHNYAPVEPVTFAPTPYPSHQDFPHTHQHPLQSPPIYNDKGYSTTASNPFFVLRSVSKAFDTFAYKLSCLYDGTICPVNLSAHSRTFRRYPDTSGIDHRDLEKACCRVETGVHAFGGYSLMASPHSPLSDIFRNRTSYDNEHYESMIHRQRYDEMGDRGELENSPPLRERSWSGRSNGPRRPNSTFRDEHDAPPSPGISAFSSVVPVDNQQKMRYRCKLCHKLKQNHSCPYRKSLHRSIGVTVHPSVNAFQAAEPGRLAPPLSAMNNRATYCEDSIEYPEGLSPDHTKGISTPRISPDNTQNRLLHYSPESSLSTDSGQRKHLAQPRPLGPCTPCTENLRHSCRVPKDKPLFVESMELKPEQFRSVTLSKLVDGGDAFFYPPVPLPFEQRRRLSDTLFALARQVPRLNEECAGLLRSARRNNEWDLGVAQLLCQLVVGLYCAEGDHRLDGLKHYLLRMGISC